MLDYTFIDRAQQHRFLVNDIVWFSGTVTPPANIPLYVTETNSNGAVMTGLAPGFKNHGFSTKHLLNLLQPVGWMPQINDKVICIPETQDFRCLADRYKLVPPVVFTYRYGPTVRSPDGVSQVVSSRLLGLAPLELANMVWPGYEIECSVKIDLEDERFCYNHSHRAEKRMAGLVQGAEFLYCSVCKKEAVRSI